MKTHPRLLALILIIALLAACTPAPTSAPNATSTPLISTPLPTSTHTPEPESTPTAKMEIPLEMQSVTIAAAKNFANAMTNAGMPITFEQVLEQGLVIKQDEKNGNKFEVATTQDEYPLMIKMEGGEWEELNPKIAGDINDFSTLVTVDLGDSNHNDSGYLASAEMFSGIVPSGGFMEAWFHQYPPTMYVSEVAKNNISQFRIQQLFWHQDIPKDITPQKAGEYITHRIDDILPTLQQLKGHKVEIVLVNEPTWCSNGTCGIENSSLQQGLGPEWIGQAFVELFNKAKSSGLEYGTDYTVMLMNNYQVEIPTKIDEQKSDYDIQLGQSTKEYIQSQLGFTPEVTYGVQFHIGESKNGYFKVDQAYLADPTNIPKLIEHFQKLSQIGKVQITELDFDQSVSEADRAIIIRNVVQASLRSNVVKGLTFWSGLRANNDFGDQNLFDLNTYKPEAEYFELIKALISN